MRQHFGLMAEAFYPRLTVSRGGGYTVLPVKASRYEESSAILWDAIDLVPCICPAIDTKSKTFRIMRVIKSVDSLVACCWM